METLASSVCILSHRFGAARTRRTPKVTLKIPDQISPHRRLNAKRRQRGLQLRGHATHRFHALLTCPTQQREIVPPFKIQKPPIARANSLVMNLRIVRQLIGRQLQRRL